MTLEVIAGGPKTDLDKLFDFDASNTPTNYSSTLTDFTENDFGMTSDARSELGTLQTSSDNFSNEQPEIDNFSFIEDFQVNVLF